MNEIDPSTNGSLSSTENQHQQEQSANKSPLLSSLLTSASSTISNGQQDKSSSSSSSPSSLRNAHGLLMMPSSAGTGTSAIVSNPQYHIDEASAIGGLKRAPPSPDTAAATEFDQQHNATATNNSNSKRYSNLNDILQRNNNNNKVASSEVTTTPTKSILENCLLKPSTLKSQQHYRVESQFYNSNNKTTTMNESEYHTSSGGGGGSSTSPPGGGGGVGVLKYVHQMEESRKVEPLKINLNREPIRTVIKLPQTHAYDNNSSSSGSTGNSPTKITIKPPQPPPDRNNSVITSPSASISISPTLSSSSLSSESSYETLNDSQQQQHRPSSIQVVPKLHLRTPLNHEQSELHIVPKLTITGLNSPQTSATLQQPQQQQQQQQTQQNEHSARDHSSSSSSSSVNSNSINAVDSPAIPKLTLKKDNNTNEGFYALNHEGNAISKRHSKANHLHHHHHHHNAQKDVKLTIKPIAEQPPPPVPKLTIKTTDNDTMTVVNSNTSFEHAEQQSATIPKLTIKASQQSSTPKLTIKPIVRPDEAEEHELQQQQQQPPPVQEESIPKLTLKAISNSSNFEKVVPKLVVKLPKEAQNRNKKNEDEEDDEEEEEEEKESSSCSSTPSPPPLVPKLNIKPIIKEVPKQQQQQQLQQPVKNCTTDSATAPPQADIMKFSINRLIGSKGSSAAVTQKEEEEEDERELREINACKPLEINTSVLKSADSGQDSPRIILKINKTNNESITTELLPTTDTHVQKTINHNKRTHSNDMAGGEEEEEEQSKKPKLTHETDDVIVINDSDASSEANSNQMKNHLPAQVQEALNAETHSQTPSLPPKAVEDASKVNSTSLASGRSLRQSRRTLLQKETPPPVVTKAQLRKQKQQQLKEQQLQQQQQQEEAEAQQTNSSPLTAALQPEQENTSHSMKEDSTQANDAMLDPLALSNDGTVNSNSVDELITPKRGRGRPKKAAAAVSASATAMAAIQEELSESRDPLEISSAKDNSSQENSRSGDVNEISSESGSKKTPGQRGRGRGRGRLKRTVEVMKNGKPIQITLEGHDDDDSPSFSLYNRSLRGGFGGGAGVSGKRLKGKSIRGKGSKSSPFLTPERSKDGNFMTPTVNSDVKENRRKLFNTPSLFEEDTRMSIGGSETPMRSSEMLHSNEESQSSILSSTSNTVEGSTRKKMKKMEVCEPEGRTEFTIDMIAEYDWPPYESSRNRETYMIQEQIAEYLGVKSFKRKYPDLMRRPVDMEERNFLFENGLASEKMCDLGLTAIYASEVLDIMCNDYPDKYEEYKRYQRERVFRHARLRLETAVVDRSQMQKDKAISSASDWNTKFNKDRRENRRCCMDLQNFLVQKPTPVRDYKTAPSATHQSAYPVALVPGQFSEYYEQFTPEQLACYPINTILVEFDKLQSYLKTHQNPYESSDSSDSSDNEDDDSSSTSSASSSDSDSDSSSADDYEDPTCRVCSQTPYTNKFNKPEKFVKCSTCKHQAHPSCIDMPQRMYVRSMAYKWQCTNCKTCCKCEKPKDHKMLYCTQCDRGFHIYCLGLRNVPEGQYHCVNCTICSDCGAKSPEGHFNPALTQQQRQDLAMIAQWNHEFTVNRLTNLKEHKASLCLPCFRKNNQKKAED